MYYKYFRLSVYELPLLASTHLRVADAVALAVARTVAASVGGRGVVAVPLRHLRAGAAGPRALRPAGPRPPLAVDGRRTLAHGHAAPHHAPLGERGRGVVRGIAGGCGVRLIRMVIISPWSKYVNRHDDNDINKDDDNEGKEK